MSLLRDWRNQLSWGRFCSAVALVVAVTEEFRGSDVKRVALWLAIATGNYTVSKIVEAITNRGDQ